VIARTRQPGHRCPSIQAQALSADGDPSSPKASVRGSVIVGWLRSGCGHHWLHHAITAGSFTMSGTALVVTDRVSLTAAMRAALVVEASRTVMNPSLRRTFDQR
jgi:hypothetical protein